MARKRNRRMVSADPPVAPDVGIVKLLGGLATDATYKAGRRRYRGRRGSWRRIEIRHNEIDIVSTGGCDTLIIQNLSIRVEGRKLFIEGKR